MNWLSCDAEDLCTLNVVKLSLKNKLYIKQIFGPYNRSFIFIVTYQAWVALPIAKNSDHWHNPPSGRHKPPPPTRWVPQEEIFIVT